MVNRYQRVTHLDVLLHRIFLAGLDAWKIIADDVCQDMTREWRTTWEKRRYPMYREIDELVLKFAMLSTKHPELIYKDVVDKNGRRRLYPDRLPFGTGRRHLGGRDVIEQSHNLCKKRFAELLTRPKHGKYQDFIDDATDELVTNGPAFPHCDHEFRKRCVPFFKTHQWYVDRNMPDLICFHCKLMRKSKHNRKPTKQRGPRFHLEDWQVREIREFWKEYEGIRGVLTYLSMQYGISKPSLSQIITRKFYKNVA